MRQLLFVLFLLATLPAAPLGATPIQYRVSMTVPTYRSHPLGGANLQFDLTWDAAPLSPISDFSDGDRRRTQWPVTNSLGAATISGAAQFDGVYPVSFDNWWEPPQFTNSWRLEHSKLRGLFQGLPSMLIEVGEVQLVASGIYLEVKSFGDDGAQAVYPQPFTMDRVTRGHATLTSAGRNLPGMKVDHVDAYAVVPEPATIALCVGGVCIALLRPLIRPRRA